MTATEIQKFKKYSTAQLKVKAQTAFNKWIRNRDSGLPCISCGTGKPEHAGHFYSAGHHNSLRFNEDNVHLQCVRCNYFLHGNLIGYRKGLEKKIGLARLKKLDELAAIKKAHKIDRFELIEIILKYHN